MKELKQLKQELEMIKDNISRVEKFVDNNKGEKWKPYTSHVFGELKHRLICVKSTITRFNKNSTRDLF